MMSTFTLKNLNFHRSRRWIIDARDRQDSDPVYSFIASWISFNHFYGTFASSNNKDFLTWSKSNMNGSSGDKAQLLFLITRKEFMDFFSEFKSQKNKLFESKVKLPVINLLNKQGVPDGLEGEYKLANLNVEQIFQIIYQIRNNLFHGNKEPFTDQRDKSLSHFGSQFMLLFMSTLLTNTLGEILDAFDNEQQQEIKDVANIAKTSLAKQ